MEDNKYLLMPDMATKISPVLSAAKYKSAEDFQAIFRYVFCEMGLMEEKYRPDNIGEEIKDIANEVYNYAVKRADGWYNRHKNFFNDNPRKKKVDNSTEKNNVHTDTERNLNNFGNNPNEIPF